MKTIIAILLLASLFLPAAGHEQLPYTHIDPACFWKAPPIDGQIVIAAVKQPKWDHRGGENTRWLICYNGILVMTGKTEAQAWRNWVQIDLTRRLELIERRARESQELTIGADHWQY